MSRFFLPRLRDFLFVLILIGGLVTGTRMLNTDGDLGRNLTLGNHILSSHSIPTTDLFSFTKAGESRPPYEWLADVLFALAYRLLNLDGIVMLTSISIATAFVVVYLDAARRGAAPILALFLSMWAAIASSLHWLARPHVFSFLFLAIWLAMLERLRRGERQPLWQFPLLMLFWANTHGGFLYGFLAFAAYFGGWLIEYWRKHLDLQPGLKWLIVGGTAFAASILTPDLWRNWAAVLSNRSGFVLTQTVETMPLNLALLNAWPFMGLVVLTTALMILNWRTQVPAHIFLLAGFGAMSLAMARNVPLFVIAAAPICSNMLTRLISRFGLWIRLEEGISHIDSRLRGVLWPALTILVTFGLLFYRLQTTGSTVFQWSPRTFPVAAVDWLERNPQTGHMFNDLNWGGYLLFRLWPAQRVFVDSQTDFYGEPFLRQYVNILDGNAGWDVLLRQSDVNWMLLPPWVPLASIADPSPGWRVAYQDATAVILVRR